MPLSSAISAYPWGQLERVPRAVARDWGKIHRRLASASPSTAAPIARALESWLEAPVHFEWHSLSSMVDEPSSPTGRLRLRLSRGQGELIVCMDARLITRLVAFALKHEGTFYDPLQQPSEEMLGGLAAIAAKLIDDAALDLDVEFITEPLMLPTAIRIQLDSALHIGGTAYPVVLGIIIDPMALASDARQVPLSRLGSMPLSLPLVVGTSLVTRDVLAELAPGKAFLTGSGLWVDADRVGHGLLIAPLSDRGLAVDLEPGARIVLRDGGIALNHDHSAPTETLSAEVSSIADTVYEAPVVLRVELGTVSLPAKQWSELRVGDIVETGQPLGTEVTLRVAGQALARGELLNIDGELGVRITKLLTGES
jgi:flagellar motor switch/type III secretory pathway protein FliN